MNEQIEQIKEKMIHPKATSLNMARVPIQTAEIFKKFANDEFVGDYGIALKYLTDKLLVEPQPFIQIHEVLVDHESRLAKLEGSPDKKNVRVIKTLDGKKREVPAKEGDE